MGVLKLKYYHLQRGRVWKYENVQWSHAGFPRRATLSAQKGERQYTEETTSGAAPTSLPEGALQYYYAIYDIWS